MISPGLFHLLKDVKWVLFFILKTEDPSIFTSLVNLHISLKHLHIYLTYLHSFLHLVLPPVLNFVILISGNCVTTLNTFFSYDVSFISACKITVDGALKLSKVLFVLFTRNMVAPKSMPPRLFVNSRHNVYSLSSW